MSWVSHSSLKLGSGWCAWATLIARMLFDAVAEGARCPAAVAHVFAKKRSRSEKSPAASSLRSSENKSHGVRGAASSQAYIPCGRSRNRGRLIVPTLPAVPSGAQRLLAFSCAYSSHADMLSTTFACVHSSAFFAGRRNGAGKSVSERSPMNPMYLPCIGPAPDGSKCL